MVTLLLGNTASSVGVQRAAAEQRQRNCQQAKPAASCLYALAKAEYA